MEYNFSNKVVLVTGASAGIGAATALLFAKLGAKLAIVGRDVKCLQDIAEKCKQEKGQEVLPIVADLSTDVGCEKTASETLKSFGRLDILVNNAAIGAKTTIQTTDMETFDRVFALNVRGVYNLTRLLVPALIESKGNIVNISSIVAFATSVGSLPYGMSKASLDHFTRLIALELAPKGVRVNSVNPGVTRSKFLQRVTSVSDEKYNEIMADASKMIPLGSVCDGEDIAKMVVHISSDHSRLVTGTMVVVDGGLQYNYHTNLLQKSE